MSVFERLEELAHVESSDIAHAKYLRKSSQKWSVRQHVLHAHCGEGAPTFAAHSVVPLAKTDEVSSSRVIKVAKDAAKDVTLGGV